MQYAAPVAGALLVLVVGKWLASRGAPEAAQAAAPSAPAARVDRVLLPVDGSDGALAAVRQVIALAHAHPEPTAFSVDLLNVQPAMSRDVSSFVAGKTLQEYHAERSAEDLAAARALLDGAKLTYRTHTRVGQAAPLICEAARELGVDQIVIGTRGQGAAAAAIMGSVASETVEKASMPVLVVKN
jgi:nucleotide-binding universal stress UspA family protein